jgi:hypothetical protein
MFVYFAKYDTPHFYDTLKETTDAVMQYYFDYPYTRDTLYICEVLSAKRPVAPIVEIETVMVSELTDLLETNKPRGQVNSICGYSEVPAESI